MTLDVNFSGFAPFFSGNIFSFRIRIILLIGLTLLFMSDGIPSLVKQFSWNSSTIWNFGIVAMGTMTVIIYLAKR